MKQNFAVLGASNGGQVIAAYLKLMGKRVTLYDRFPQVLQPIRDRGGIQLEGLPQAGFARLDGVYDQVAPAVAGAQVIFVVLPAFAHAYVAGELAGCGVCGLAVVSALFGAEDVEAAARALRREAERVALRGEEKKR